jgi:hypothetical protein
VRALTLALIWLVAAMAVPATAERWPSTEFIPFQIGRENQFSSLMPRKAAEPVTKNAL